MKPGSLIEGLFDDVRDVLTPQQNEQAEPFSLHYLIEDNNDPANDRNVSILYDPYTGAPISAEEYYDNGEKIKYDTAKDLFDTINNNGNYTVISAPIDIYGPRNISALGDATNSATVYHDTGVDGPISPETVFNLGNYGVRAIGDRRGWGKSSAIGNMYYPGYPSFENTYRNGLLRRGARNSTLWGNDITGQGLMSHQA